MEKIFFKFFLITDVRTTVICLLCICRLALQRFAFFFFKLYSLICCLFLEKIDHFHIYFRNLYETTCTRTVVFQMRCVGVSLKRFFFSLCNSCGSSSSSNLNFLIIYSLRRCKLSCYSGRVVLLLSKKIIVCTVFVVHLQN